MNTDETDKHNATVDNVTSKAIVKGIVSICEDRFFHTNPAAYAQVVALSLVVDILASDWLIQSDHMKGENFVEGDLLSSHNQETSLHMPVAITKIGNRGIGESGNRGIGECGNGKRYRYAVCGIITNYQIQVYSQKIKGIPHGI